MTMTSDYIRRAVAALLLSAMMTACGPGQPSGNFRLMHNNDGTDLLGNRWHACRPITVADLDECIDMVVDSPVTTFVMCSGGDAFYYPTKYGRIIGDDRNGTIPIGEDTAQFLANHEYYLNYLRLKEEGVDFVGHCLERARSKGKETFISYRMNDLHSSSSDGVSEIARPDIYIQHPECLINDGDAQGWHSGGGIDFELKAMRDRKVGIVREQLELYGNLIDGYELDFLRFPVYFKPGRGPLCTALMTDMVKEMRSVVDSVSKVVGHKIMLTVRVASTIEDNLKLGIDIREWLRLDLVDFVTMGAYWRGDPQLPVANFRHELGADLDVPLYACIDDGGYDKRESWSHGQMRGMCSNILAQGADGVYLFNYYFGTWCSKADIHDHLEEGGQVLRVPNPALMDEMVSLDALEGRNKTFLISDGKREFVLTPSTRLPMKISGGHSSSVELMVGDSFSKGLPEEVILFVRAGGDIRVSVNGTAVSSEDGDLPALYDKCRNMEPGFVEHAYIVDPKLITHGFNRIFFSSTEDVQIKRVELTLKYGEVDECGYF